MLTVVFAPTSRVNCASDPPVPPPVTKRPLPVLALSSMWNMVDEVLLLEVCVEVGFYK